MTDMKQPENWRRMLADLGGYENGLINIPAAGVIPIIDEVEKLRAKLDQATVALKDISNDNWPDAGINPGEYANLVLHELAAGARPVELAPAGEYPPLPEWSKMDNLGGLVPSEIRRELRAYIDADRAMRAAQPAPAAQDDAKDAARYRWLRDPTTDVALVLDKRTGYVPADEQVPGVGDYYTYEYRAGIELDAAIDSALAADKKEPTNGN